MKLTSNSIIFQILNVSEHPTNLALVSWDNVLDLRTLEPKLMLRTIFWCRLIVFHFSLSDKQ